MSEGIPRIGWRKWTVSFAGWLVIATGMGLYFRDTPSYNKGEMAKIETLKALNVEKEGPQDLGCVACITYSGDYGIHDLIRERREELGCSLETSLKQFYHTNKFDLEGISYSVTCVNFQ
jgi:hypothetical protein